MRRKARQPATATVELTADGDLEAPQRRLLDYLDSGYEIFLLVGIGGAGKTELLGAYRQDGYLNRFKRSVEGTMKSTDPQDFDTYPVSGNGRKVMFVDASGEDFRLLYPSERPDQHLDDKTYHIRFLRLVARGLKGLVLLLDLKLLWHEKLRRIQTAHARQVDILCWVVELLRWLRYDGKYEPSDVSFEEQVDRSVRQMKKRLQIPVQVIFSKADELVGMQLPKEVFSTGWIRRGPSPERQVFPIGEDPLLFAYHCLPSLYNALNNHADHFRFDFAHSLVLDPGSGTVADPNSCGVTLSLRWLLDPIWGRRGLIPTRTWIAAQRFLDERILRNRRWQKLPDPVDVRE